jgi:acetyl esterase/lipase
MIVRAQTMCAATPFLDTMYDCATTANIVYGKGALGNPTSAYKGLTLDLYQPTGVTATGATVPATLPGLVVVHGGAFEHGSAKDRKIVELCKKYSKRGYVCAAINYRLIGDNPSPGKGPQINFVVEGRAVNAAIQDAATAVRWLRSNASRYKIDPNRIAILGGSAGATTSLYEGVMESNMIPANSQVAAIVDLWGGLAGQDYLIDANDPPVFVVHGTADAINPIQSSINLTEQCSKVGVPYDFYPLDRAGHSAWKEFWTTVVMGKTVDRHCAEFLYNHLDLPKLQSDLSVISIQATDSGSGGPASNRGTFLLSRSGNLNSALRVKLTLGGAAKGVDYTKLSRSVSFASGEKSKLINIFPLDDTLVVEVANGKGYTPGWPSRAHRIVSDND